MADFLNRMLDFEPGNRATAAEALLHPWLDEVSPPRENAPPAETEAETGAETGADEADAVDETRDVDDVEDDDGVEDVEDVEDDDGVEA